ncbi:MAG: hypothetical protein ACXABY_19045 [Candidatus Thorarchaeota archaeon]|jgi:hypothetical protein
MDLPDEPWSERKFTLEEENQVLREKVAQLKIEIERLKKQLAEESCLVVKYKALAVSAMSKSHADN